MSIVSISVLLPFHRALQKMAVRPFQTVDKEIEEDNEVADRIRNPSFSTALFSTEIGKR